MVLRLNKPPPSKHEREQCERGRLDASFSTQQIRSADFVGKCTQEAREWRTENDTTTWDGTPPATRKRLPRITIEADVPDYDFAVSPLHLLIQSTNECSEDICMFPMAEAYVHILQQSSKG